MSNKYLLKPVLNTVKQSFYLEDENGETVYEGKMMKFSLLGASPFEFVNHITNKTEEHKVGKTITSEQGGGGLLTLMSKKSSFKFDGQNIWDYLHEQVFHCLLLGEGLRGGNRLRGEPARLQVEEALLVFFLQQPPASGGPVG